MTSALHRFRRGLLGAGMWAAVAGAAGLAAAGGTARHAVDPAEAANVFGAACGNTAKAGDGCGVKINSGPAASFCKGDTMSQRLKVTDSIGTSCYTVENCVKLYPECGSWHSAVTCAPSTTSAATSPD